MQLREQQVENVLAQADRMSTGVKALEARLGAEFHIAQQQLHEERWKAGVTKSRNAKSVFVVEWHSCSRYHYGVPFGVFARLHFISLIISLRRIRR